MAKRINISSGAPWEDKVGYSRAVRVGAIIEVSGTVAVKNGETIGVGDAYQQTLCILEIIKKSLEEAGSALQDVIRTRMYVTDISLWNEIAKAHSEYFKEIKPATSMIEVKGLISKEYLVEIEATAIAS